ncbi:hypothetical protein LZ023_39990 (plasmid) [Pseudomonas silvicola]|nr:hypothetical protein LZ023_39990 [Pseudomonas silvicola]
METLGRRTRETVDLCVWRGSHTVLVSQYASDQELRVVSPISTAFPTHCAAHGKALLSEQTDDVISALLPQLNDVRTLNTLRDPQLLLKAIQQVREQGYAVDREEHARGVCGISVALNTGSGERYALAIAVPSLRFDEQFPQLLAALLQANWKSSRCWSVSNTKPPRRRLNIVVASLFIQLEPSCARGCWCWLQ